MLSLIHFNVFYFILLISLLVSSSVSAKKKRKAIKAVLIRGNILLEDDFGNHVGMDRSKKKKACVRLQYKILERLKQLRNHQWNSDVSILLRKSYGKLTDLLEIKHLEIFLYLKASYLFSWYGGELNAFFAVRKHNSTEFDCK